MIYIVLNKFADALTEEWRITVKKIVCILLVLLMFGSTCVFAANVPIIASYTAAFSDKQGVNCFYFCENKSGQVKELVYNIEANGNKRWISESGEYPMLSGNYATPSGASDFDIMFVSPMRGTVQLKGIVKRAPDYIGDSTFGDGVNLSILKNSRAVWSGSIDSDEASAEYDVTLSLAAGDKLHFVINCRQHNYFDATEWYPTVNYISNEYVRDEFDPRYFQKCDGEMKELAFSETEDGYMAEDGVAFVSDSAVMPSGKYSVVKRFKIGEMGRYRVYAPIKSNSATGFGNIVKVLKNDEEIWKQLIVPGKTNTLDIGVFAEKDDYIDVEVGINGYAGFNRCEWTCDATKYMGKLFKECDTSVGEKYTVRKEYSLSSFIKQADSEKVGIYSEKYSKAPMVYNSASNRWESGVSGEKDYVSETTACPGVTTNAVIDIKLPQDGILKLGGKLNIDSASDGVLTKVYLNGRLLWSNRVGSEQSLRWDDKFDEGYFLNNINAMAKVKSGDVLSFTFNKWRENFNDHVDITDVRLMYVEGGVLSETTKWKLKNSMIIDTTTGELYNNGTKVGNINVTVKNGKSYIAKSDLEKVFGEKSDVIAGQYASDDEIPVRNAAKLAGKPIFWAADKMIILYDGISVFYGYSEEGEIRTQLELGGDLFE